MTRSYRRLGLADAGYTLIEMLVVLAIIALVSAVVLPSLTRPSENLRLQTAAREIVGALRLTRTTAIARNTAMVMEIDVEQRTFQSPAVSLRKFASDVTAQLKIAEPERTTKSTGGFRFFPDGSSTGGDLVLALHGKQTTICVHWLTGEPRLATSC